MVTENEQVGTTTEPQAEVQIEDNTQETVAETTEQPTAEGAGNTAQPTTEATTEATTKEPAKIDMSDSEGQLNQEQLQFIANQQNEQLQYYKRMEEDARLRDQAGQYRKQLEDDGYDSSQAEAAAQNYFKSQQDIKTQQDIARTIRQKKCISLLC